MSAMLAALADVGNARYITARVRLPAAFTALERYMAMVRWRHNHHSWREPRVIRYGGGEPFSAW